MPRKAPAKKNQPPASKKKASNVNASSKNHPPKRKRSAAASKTKSSGNSIDALVKKQITSLRQADTLFKDVIAIVEIYRKKHPELDQYIPSVDSTQREIKVRDASSEDANLQYRFHIEVVDGDPRYGVTLDQSRIPQAKSEHVRRTWIPTSSLLTPKGKFQNHRRCTGREKNPNWQSVGATRRPDRSGV